MTNQDSTFDWCICFYYNRTIIFIEHRWCVYTFQHFKTNLVAQCHFEYCFGYATFAKCPCCFYFSFVAGFVYQLPHFFDGCHFWLTFFIIWSCKQIYIMPRCFKFRRQYFFRVNGTCRKGHQCRRNIQIHEGTGHGVFPANCTYAVRHLCFECTQQSRHRHRPAFAVATQAWEIFLECQIAVFCFAAGCYDSRQRFGNCAHCA